MSNTLKNFYFTFGTSPSFPFKECYIIVKAHSREEAVFKFQSKYADENDACINCSFIYSEDEWNNDNIGRYYDKPRLIMN